MATYGADHRGGRASMTRRKPAIDVLSLRNVVSRMAHCVGAGADTWFRGTETRRVERGRAGCVECDLRILSLGKLLFG